LPRKRDRAGQGIVPGQTIALIGAIATRDVGRVIRHRPGADRCPLLLQQRPEYCSAAIGRYVPLASQPRKRTAAKSRLFDHLVGAH
jgi:hypothetical protein